LSFSQIEKKLEKSYNMTSKRDNGPRNLSQRFNLPKLSLMSRNTPKIDDDFIKSLHDEAKHQKQISQADSCQSYSHSISFGNPNDYDHGDRADAFADDAMYAKSEDNDLSTNNSSKLSVLNVTPSQSTEPCSQFVSIKESSLNEIICPVCCRKLDRNKKVLEPFDK
jgi:hypothetical protein